MCYFKYFFCDFYHKWFRVINHKRRKKNETLHNLTSKPTSKPRQAGINKLKFCAVRYHKLKSSNKWKIARS